MEPDGPSGHLLSSRLSPTPQYPLKWQMLGTCVHGQEALGGRPIIHHMFPNGPLHQDKGEIPFPSVIVAAICTEWLLTGFFSSAQSLKAHIDFRNIFISKGVQKDFSKKVSGLFDFFDNIFIIVFR